jgi:sulfur carrier protein ThiS adenylyltransferase
MAERFSFREVTACYFTTHQIDIIEQIKIGIAGTGGIGSNCAMLLVRCGFIHFTVADFDRVTVSNLNRQAYNTFHIGKEKVRCLTEICSSINPDITMSTFNRRIDASTMHDVFDDCDVIIEAFDDPASKALLFSEYLHSNKLLVGVSGIAGFGNSNRISIRNVRNNCYIVGDSVSAVSTTLKPHGPLVTIAAAKMADIVLDWALKRS